MTIALRADMDYSDVPKLNGFTSHMRIAKGLSAPKILTAQCSDGQQFKQLVSYAPFFYFSISCSHFKQLKGGHDDLRQDAIMEQVFQEISKIIRNHTATRQRNLLIRT
jgi:ataxia telangiectasia mutated family protein